MSKVTVTTFFVILIGAVIGDQNLDLWNAAKEANIAGVESALASGADPNFAKNVDVMGETEDLTNVTPLYWAAGGNYPVVIVEMLLDAGANIEVQTSDGHTPLWVASVFGNTDAVKILINRGANIDIPDNRGRTPLFMAIANAMRIESVNTVKVLINGNANVRLSDNTGSTALHQTSHLGMPYLVDIARLLLQNGADIHQQDNKGRTALHAAAYSNRTGVALLLLQEGASAWQQDNEGKTPIDIAREEGYDQLADILESESTTSDLYLFACGFLAMFIGETLSYVLH